MRVRPVPLPLPIDSILPELIRALQSGSGVVVRAPTGAGKTTRVPPALLDAGLAGQGRIVMLEPRRLAARAAARRMASERGGRVGEEVGHHVRFDRAWGPRTRILVVTPGILLRMLLDDPYLESASVVLFDEFHERGLESDLALGMARLVQQTVRPELKIGVMSATLAVETVARYLGNCPSVACEGRLFPVEIVYERRSLQQSWPVAAARAVERLLDRTDGDVLVFLPGIREIRQTARELEPVVQARNLAVLPLHGDLPAEQQDAALQPLDRRKVVLATNVAETSVTVEDVTGVVDTGLARMLELDPHVGLNRLRLVGISRGSADQRAGRAGRTRPGVCLRLWSEAAQRARPEQTEPEIHRIDLGGAALQLLCLGEEVSSFPWLEPPREPAISQAMLLLNRLGALEQRGASELGKQLARLPLHPRLGRLLLEGRRLGDPNRAALAAALLAERDPFLRSTEPPRQPRRLGISTSSDLLDRVMALEEFEKHGRHETALGTLNRAAVRFILRSRDQLLREVRGVEEGAASAGVAADEALPRALLAAFPDRVARRREPGSPKGVMVGGRGVRLAPTCRVAEAELFVCIDVDAGQTEALVRQASAIRRDWLPADKLVTGIEVEFDPVEERVNARKRVRYEDLLLEESAAALPDAEEVGRVLAVAALAQLERVLPPEDSIAGLFLTRVRCLRQWLPELQLPPFDAGELRELVPGLCIGCRSFAELRQADWLEALSSRLTPPQRQAVDREAPERITMPSGSRLALRYELGRPPVLAVRIQELFGLQQTPRVAAGRVPVLLHLLGPNFRPQQVTDDLASFWANTYPQVRKQLRARYPKHAWPEDPLTAIARPRHSPRRP